MKKILIAAGALLLASAAVVQNAFQVKPNPENVVAKRLEGVWILDEPKTHWLGSSKDIRGFAFVRDEKIAAQIPEKFKELLTDDIYLAGTVHIVNDPFPFVLTSANGIPRILVFKPEGGEKFGRAEPINLMLCPGLEKNKDMLFAGGAKNDRPFAVFIRKDLAPDKGN